VARPVPPPPLQTVDVVAAVSAVASVLALLGPLVLIFAVGYSHATRLTLLVAWPCALVLLYVARTLREGRRLAPRRRLQPRQNGKPLPS